ncbi:hypothetical protein RSOLAG22IIIB_05705 [Rhizoctonia solani]|uniref:Asl1-like glycosyl hydrolase catalytic domain-containing protein n=1 Tax=Rhizoctonia solani TaxID=456999 RepID=A0A0K6G8F8_9AGAM|nr:hypothetical protein RSOLAG22IIIB_05705 [Rhizoctonia solani]
MSWVYKFTTLAMTFFSTGPLEGKRGLAWPWYNENTNLDPAKFTDGHNRVRWYLYMLFKESLIVKIITILDPGSITLCSHLNWIGMQRCMDCDSSPISQLKTRAQQQGWNTVLTLNEPDINGISAPAAAQWYIQHINPLKIKKAIPAVTSSATPGKGLDWTADFISACAGHCQFDFINIHWYGHNFNEFKSHVQKAHSRFPNHKLIISEFALLAPADRDHQVAFLKSAMSFLDGADYVKYYAVFIASSPTKISANKGGGDVGIGSSLYENDGSLSTNGIAYCGVRIVTFAIAGREDYGLK